MELGLASQGLVCSKVPSSSPLYTVSDAFCTHTLGVLTVAAPTFADRISLDSYFLVITSVVGAVSFPDPMTVGERGLFRFAAIPFSTVESIACIVQIVGIGALDFDFILVALFPAGYLLVSQAGVG